MTTEVVAPEPGIALARELTLFEYGTCADPVQANLLYNHRPFLDSYLKDGYLTLAFDKDHEPCIRGTDFVGLLPFSVEGQSHLLLVAPKGSQQNENLGLLRFLQLLTFVNGGTPPDNLPGFEGKRGPHLFLLFLAHHYARLLGDLCLRDFRSYYRAEEDDLRCRIRGRLNLSAYARRAVQGKPHILPCRWDEFTVDNWDNRILWAAARRLKVVAAALDPQAARWVWEPFRRLLSWFGPVAETQITTADFHKSRLGRISPYYHRALVWARLLLQGGDLPRAGGQAPPLVFDAPDAFEKFAEAIARYSRPDGSWHCHFQNDCSFPFLTEVGKPDHLRTPDIILWGPGGICAVGETKYKDVLKEAASTELKTAKEVMVHIQPADWNQLYVYMRMKKASSGFFIVPFWNVDGPPCDWIESFRFIDRPDNITERIAVLALNLLKPPVIVKYEAAKRLREWLSSAPREPLLLQPIPHSG
jgi:5-methylcytosine-specific restriction enzyme subunit McrC